MNLKLNIISDHTLWQDKALLEDNVLNSLTDLAKNTGDQNTIETVTDWLNQHMGGIWKINRIK